MNQYDKQHKSKRLRVSNVYLFSFDIQIIGITSTSKVELILWKHLMIIIALCTTNGVRLAVMVDPLSPGKMAVPTLGIIMG